MSITAPCRPRRVSPRFTPETAVFPAAFLGFGRGARLVPVLLCRSLWM